MSIRVRTGSVLMLVLLSLGASLAHAAARASLQPDRITLGNTATLTIQTDEVNVTPDFSVLDQSFIVRAQSSSVQTSINNGSYSAQTSFAIELEPRVEGVLTVPPIRVGNSSTEPLSLTVMPAQQGSAGSGDPIYIESEIGTTTPYVQQAVPYTVRLYYAVPLLGGDVTAPAPDNANLQQLGEDRQSQVEIGGRRYGVFERRYLLTAEQSGPLELPAARFRGNAQSAANNGFFTRSQNVSAAGQAFSLNVKPQPPGAPQPWLAARSLGLARVDLPASARVGEPLLIEISLTADGVTSAQLPDLELPPIDGAQVFPEPAQRQDRIVDGQPVATLKRRFALVPAREGTLALPELRLGYWNLDSDRADTARLAPVSLTVAAGAAAQPVAPTAVIAPTLDSAGPVDAELQQQLRAWQTATAVLIAGLLLALAWGWRRGRGRRPPGDQPATAEATPADPAPLRRALADGDLQAIGDALRQATSPPCLNLGAVIERLDEHGQREAVRELQRVLWSSAATAEAHAAARARLRAAFKVGPRWCNQQRVPPAPVLPALYPTV
jgi:hypothetical protein